MSEFRGFISLDIKNFSKIKRLQNEIEKTGAHLKIVKPENIHVTLKFLGDTSNQRVNEIEKIMKESTEDIKPFKIKLNETGVFPNRNYIKVIWIGIKDNGETTKIANKSDEKLSTIGFKKEKRDFFPHLTIARVKSGKNKNKILQKLDEYNTVEFGEQTVKSIKLKKSELTSEGPIYSTIKEVEI